jgi:phosphopentomutase
MRRAIIVVLDSVGVGELPDAHLYQDQGSNTLANTAAFVHGLKLPNLQMLGLGNIADVQGVRPVRRPLGAYGKMAERSAGKDSTTGHWELMGLYLPKPFPTYPHGFPKIIIDTFEAAIGRNVLGNKAASGTEIIKELGQEHIRTGFPIVYTSADSVFQIAAHETIIAPDKLYEMCKIARRIMTGENSVGRVIARPFVGKPGSFKRTERRKDFSLEPPGKTVLDFALDNGIRVTGLGKIGELFGFRGLSANVHTDNNMDGLDKLIDSIQRQPDGIIFINLVEFDMLWGHRNDPVGYAKALADFDRRLPEILEKLHQEDILIITADHGCDPTTSSTDHSREYVPLIVYGLLTEAIDLGTRRTFADVGKSIADLLDFKAPVSGTSFAADLLRKQRN